MNHYTPDTEAERVARLVVRKRAFELTRGDVTKGIARYVAGHRQAGETEAAAYARLADTDPVVGALYTFYKTLPAGGRAAMGSSINPKKPEPPVAHPAPAAPAPSPAGPLAPSTASARAIGRGPRAGQATSP